MLRGSRKWDEMVEELFRERPWLTSWMTEANMTTHRVFKWTNWSAHVAWGGFIVLALDGVRILGTTLGAVEGLIISGVLGMLWELIYWICVDPSDRGYPSWVDWAWWVVGAAVGWAIAGLR